MRIALKNTQNKNGRFVNRSYDKGQRNHILCPFSHALLERYSALHLIGVLSGGNEPPFRQGSLCFVRPESLSSFPDKHCFYGDKSEAPREAGQILFDKTVLKTQIFLIVIKKAIVSGQQFLKIYRCHKFFLCTQIIYR